MDKILIYEHKQNIQSIKKTALEVESNANKAIDIFHAYQSFAKIETEKEAFTFIENPLEYFDRCMIAATNVKPLGNAPMNPESIAQMFGVSRQKFISECIARRAGDPDNSMFPIRIQPYYFPILRFDNGKFSIKNDALELRLDEHRTYADTKTKHEMLEYWEDLADRLNTHLQKGFVNRFEIYKTARVLGLSDNNGQFVVDYYNLADTFKKMK